MTKPLPQLIKIVDEELDRLHAEMAPGQEEPTLAQLAEFDKRLQERLHSE